MAGVNRSNVAVTDTFDTWRLRTNEINTTLNEATQAITANTIIFRDDSSNFTANQASLNTVAVVHGTTTSAISVTSALAADGTKASIITTGGIRAELGSIFAADVDIQGSITLGNASADNLTLNATLSSDLIPTTNAATDIGSSAFTFKNLYNQSTTITGKTDAGGPILTVLGADVDQTTANIASTSATTGNILTVSGTALTTGGVATFTSDSNNTSQRDIVKVTQDNTGATGATALHIQSDAGRAVFIENTLAAGGYALEIDADQDVGGAVKIDAATTGGASAKGVEMLFPALTTGKGLDVISASSNLGSDGAVVEISQTSGTMSSANAAVLSVNQAGNGTYGLKINSTHATANSSLRIDSVATTKNVIEVASGTSLTSGDMFNMTVGSAHTGQMISLTSSSTADSARGEAILVDYRSANTDANVFRITNTDAGTDTFTVSQGGDVMMKGNLHVKGTTTQINTTQTLVKDKTVVLGAGSDVVENLTYSQHGTAPSVTSTAHGLVTNDIIFCVAATASGVITSETLYKITRVDDNTFTLALRDGTAINTSSDSTARTFSYVGKQQDLTVDDAGIYLPGNTAIHTLKWDDTDNYWEVNDSFKVDTTAQFVLPKGTTAQRPGAATASQAQIVTGAMRYNTTNNKYEGVTNTDGTDATGWENMATESFSIAVSIALG